MKKERTLVLLKPDVTRRNLIAEIMVLATEGFKIVDLIMYEFDYREAKEFYSPHESKPFFDKLCKFMTSDKVVAMILEGDGVIETIRERVLNEIRPSYAGPKTEENAVHCSDSKAEAKREISFLFGKVD